MQKEKLAGIGIVVCLLTLVLPVVGQTTDGAIEGLYLSFDCNEDLLRPNETLVINVTLKNTKLEDQTLVFSTSQIFDFKIKKIGYWFPFKVYQWSRGKDFYKAETEITIPKDSKINLAEVEIDCSSIFKGIARFGAYELEGFLCGDYRIIEDKCFFEIRKFYGKYFLPLLGCFVRGNGTVDYTTPDKDYNPEEPKFSYFSSVDWNFTDSVRTYLAGFPAFQIMAPIPSRGHMIGFSGVIEKYADDRWRIQGGWAFYCECEVDW